MTAILIVEDNQETAADIAQELHRLGYEVGAAPDGAIGLAMAVGQRWDALVVDRMLPAMDGLSLIRELRTRDVTTPALVLSALDQVTDRITGLRAGGDDYLVKPFALGELSARIEALVRRPSREGHSRVHLGCLALDLLRREASIQGKPLTLLEREFQLLEYLAQREGQVVTRQMLLHDIFGYHFELKTNIVDVHLGRLRRKLEAGASGPTIETIRGIGFRLHAG